MGDDQDSWFKPFGFDPAKLAQEVYDKGKAVVDEGVKVVEAGVKEVKEDFNKAKEFVEDKIDKGEKAIKSVVSPSAPAPKSAASGGGASSPSSLGGSIGRGGQNNPDDVRGIQRALGIADDGKCGPGTIKAIEDFQKSIGQAKPDGRVDPGGATSRALAGGAKAAPAAAPDSPPAQDGENSGSLFDRAVQGVKDLGGKVVKEVEDDANTALGAAKDLGAKALQGAKNAGLASDLTGAAQDSGGSSFLTNLLDKAIGGAATTLENVGNLVDTPSFAPRPLKDRERSYARAIFGASLDYSPIRVIGGGVATLGEGLAHDNSRTIGNDINLSPGLFQPSGDLTDDGLKTLVHEMSHVWQFQNQGFSYIREALWAQAQAQLLQGDLSKAYDWEGPLARGIPFEKWNPEAQAEAVEDYNKALRAIQGGSVNPADYQTFAKLKDLFGKMTAGPVKVRDPDPPAGKGGKPQLSKLTPEMREDCEDYLAVHHLAAVPLGGLGLDAKDYQPAIDGKPSTFAQIAKSLRPLTLLDATDELVDLVEAEYQPLAKAAVAAAEEKLRNPV